MSFCVNPNCPHPKNPNNVQVCQACGNSLRLNGRYQTLGLLGKGGFGATFAAADVALPGTPICVVKQLRPQTDDPNVFRMAKELFEREAQTLGRVGNHPQVPRLLDYFEDDHQFYLVQEYVKGHNLHQEVKKNGTFTEGSVKQFLTEILPILDYIHSQKVIHRDIKPANLIRRQTDQKLVLIDFGAVKNQIDSVLSSNTSAQTALTAFAVGTAGFAPPEQMAMRPVYASDIYATGVTCLYLLTGKTPKEIDCNSQTGEMDWEKHVTVSSKFAEVIRKMLELSVRHRYKSAQQVLDALEMPTYEDGMMQGMVSTPFTTLTGAGDEPATGIRMGNSSSPDYGDPSTRFNTNVQPRDPSSTSLNTGIKTRTAKPRQSPRDRATSNIESPTTRVRPASNMADGGSVGAGGIDYNMVNPKPFSRREEEKQAIANQPETKRWNGKTFLAEYAQGKRDFADQNLVGIVLAKAFVPGINCYQANLTNANFEQAELTRADFGKARLKNVIFKGANLSDAYFGYADLRGADLRGANLNGVNFKYANLQGANFSGADLGSAKVSPEQLKLAKTNWRTVMPGSGRRR
ncbi:eukariotic protein kinase [Synechocystis sp. PCC 6803]|jgi:serine/threonine-protein kinase|uniref:Serine/threonine-protein kinase B n=1 Tax=Synechocystis sp. (strain ATCC 27184 / PCC 6803 / Kazusa) TaxID=1111708 RepID=SPKB_SYNY3|nr:MULTISPECIES: serine/threonine-protein kinase [unclassified Synechocystis]P74297.1 RecName: Full=Serine/threonine-protein kinase B [Synechocystis sp. PCC 6803 substr. Kazusa]BAM54891.1 eukariotic protein kinase [Synechocystis sp. PCC 6803] [Bacillus subtilis BEST7613]AGF52079.1 eukariotic protein kinase [Synechocystis sp. PCC 6803]ALJ68036.1 serine/threonine protein kinase [Synechocystis sp. PCC 6803]AVP89868.1 serine/threonine protein kinase [Synechocystis sp. IPPAS B-1465]MBD2617883.1 pe